MADAWPTKSPGTRLNSPIFLVFFVLRYSSAVSCGEGGRHLVCRAKKVPNLKGRS